MAVRHGYQPPSPAPEALVRWPEDFGARFTLLVDTEEEFDWRAPLSRDARSVTAIAVLPEAHRRFTAFGVPVTYMVDHPVAADPGAAARLREAIGHGGATIGAQLHVWVNPPFEDRARAGDSYGGNLPRSVEAAKIDVLTATIERAFGARPRAFRAGRYGIGPHTHALLAKRGYRLDSSMRARYDYRADGGPDFRAIGGDAFRAGPDGAIVELPLTTVFTGRWRARGAALHAAAGRLPKGRAGLARLGLLARVALTPEDMPLADALEAARIAVGEGARLLNFSFHSPTLVPGNTPYTRDARDLARFWRWWGAVLDELARLGVRAASVDEVIAAADAGR